MITSLDEHFDPLSMNDRYEAEKFELEPIFENTIKQIKDNPKEIKDNHLKIIPSSAINISSITSFDENFDLLSTNNSFESEHFEPETTFEKTIHDIKASHF